MRFLLDEMYAQDIAAGRRARGADAVSVHEHPELEGEPDDAEVLRAAARERRVLVSNNHKDLVPIVDRFARDGEEHYGVLLTSDRSMPRSSATVGLFVRSIVEYAAGAADDDLMNSYDWLSPAT